MCVCAFGGFCFCVVYIYIYIYRLSGAHFGFLSSHLGAAVDSINTSVKVKKLGVLLEATSPNSL